MEPFRAQKQSHSTARDATCSIFHTQPCRSGAGRFNTSQRQRHDCQFTGFFLFKASGISFPVHSECLCWRRERCTGQSRMVIPEGPPCTIVTEFSYHSENPGTLIGRELRHLPKQALPKARSGGKEQRRSRRRQHVCHVPIYLRSVLPQHNTASFSVFREHPVLLVCAARSTAKEGKNMQGPTQTNTLQYKPDIGRKWLEEMRDQKQTGSDSVVKRSP